MYLRAETWQLAHGGRGKWKQRTRQPGLLQLGYGCRGEWVVLLVLLVWRRCRCRFCGDGGLSRGGGFSASAVAAAAAVAGSLLWLLRLRSCC